MLGKLGKLGIQGKLGMLSIQGKLGTSPLSHRSSRAAAHLHNLAVYVFFFELWTLSIYFGNVKATHAVFGCNKEGLRD